MNAQQRSEGLYIELVIVVVVKGVSERESKETIRLSEVMRSSYYQ